VVPTKLVILSLVPTKTLFLIIFKLLNL